MYRLGLLTSVVGDLPRLGLWSLSAAVYGALFAVPFRKYFIIKQNLPFPSPTAAAEIIQSLHGAGGEEFAARKSKCLLWVFMSLLAICIISFFVPVLKIWDIWWWLSMAASNTEEGFGQFMLTLSNWRWYIQLSFAFFGAGMMTPVSTSVSLFGGSIVAWGILGPLLLANGVVLGQWYMDERLQNGPSARFFLLWIGITMMICSSFSELGVRWRVLWNGIRGLSISLRSAVVRRGDRKKTDEEDDDDPVPIHHQVPVLWWTLGLLVTAVFTVCLLYISFDVPVGESILAILLGIVFGFIAIQSSAETDINPIGSIAKTSQAVFAAIPNPDIRAKQTSNLISGLVAAAAASQSSSMVGDLKTGHIVGASPRSQFIAQIVGSLFSSVLGVFFWWIFTSAYPCILDAKLDDVCVKKGFGMQAVQAWYGVTIALTGTANIPAASAYACLGLGLTTIFFTIAKTFYIPQKYHDYLPNFNAIGIAFTNNDPSLMWSILAGSIAAKIWSKKSPVNAEMYLFSVAAGMIAAEGIYGVIQAVFTIFELDKFAFNGGLRQ